MLRSLLTLAVAGIVLLSSSTRAATITPVTQVQIVGEPDETPEYKRMTGIMNIPIARVNFDRLDIDKVVDFLRFQSKALDPQHVGVKFRLIWPPSGKVPFPGDKTHWMYLHRDVSITLDEVPIIELLNYIACQTNLQFAVVKDEVILAPDINVYVPSTPEPPALIPPIASPIQANLSAENMAVAVKLDSITIPNTKFNDLSLSALVDLLHTKSKDLDPQHVGVQFHLELPPETKLPSPLSVSLGKLTLFELMTCVCAQNNLTYKIVDGVVVLSPGNIQSDYPPTTKR